MAKKRPKKKTPDLAHITEQLRPLAVPMDALKLDPQNGRTHDEDNVRAIGASLKEFGQLKPIVVNRDTATILAGNGTYRAAERLGWTHLAVVYVEHDASAARGFSIADNRSAELAAWNEDVLAVLAEQMQEDTPELFKDLLLDAFLADDEEEEESAGPAGPPTSTFQVIVECRDHEDREALLGKLRREGRQCHAVTWRQD